MRVFASKVVQRSKVHRDSSHRDAAMVPTNFLLLSVGLVVCGWNIIRAYGSPFSLSIFLSPSLPHPRSRSLLPSRERFTCLARNSLPLIFLFSFFFFFLTDAFAFSGHPWGTPGLPTQLRLVTLPRHCGMLISTASRPMNPFFYDRLRSRKSIGRHVE